MGVLASNVLHHVREAWFVLWEAWNAKVHGANTGIREAIKRKVEGRYGRKRTEDRRPELPLQLG